MIRVVFILIGALVSFSASGVVSVYADEDVSNQVKGNYPDMERGDSVPLGTIQHAWNKAKGGAYNVEYRANEIIKVRLREWMDTTIVLPKYEKIQRVIVGNDSYIRATKHQDNIVTLKPLEVGVDTNLTIVAHNTYVMYVRVEGYNSKNLPDLRVNVKASPPRGLLNAGDKPLTKKEIHDYLGQAVTNPEDLDFDYAMSGNPDIAPERVYSDGIRTFLDYGAYLNKRNLPAVFLVDDEVDMPANTAVIKNSIVVDGSGILTLKNGGKTTCVYPTRLGRHSYVKK
jgi:ComB9 competence protein